MRRFEPMFLTAIRAAIPAALIAVFLTACSQNAERPRAPTDGEKTGGSLSIPFEKYTLDNGLDVVLHVDRSDPVVAIGLAAHVGSSREVTGRTGFAHLFEHLLFLDSENLGYGGLDEMNTRIGGAGTNGFTSHDMTQYFQAVPADALEKIIWAEADKLGYFINTVTQPVIDNEKQVVKNEKRQRVDNQPYGHNFYVINKALYPSDHPYNWQVIGSLADLDAATLQDVKDFYRQWYVPNNVTVTLSGDFDVAEAKRLVEKYFGEIPRGPDVNARTPRPAVLEETRSFIHEDAFATVPQLTMVWPAVAQYHQDSYALNILATYLTDGKRAPLNAVLIDEERLTSTISSFYYGKELAGEFYIASSANAGEDLDNLVPAIEKAFARFEANGISEEDLSRIKARLEVAFYGRVQSVLGKAVQLGEYNLFADDPGFISKDIENLLSVTPDDVMRVYNQYLKDKHRVYTSFVPKGQRALAMDEGIPLREADIVEEPIIQGAEQAGDFDPTARTFERTPSSFDRTVEPEFGPPYTLPSPKVWRGKLANGIEVYGIENDETPLVYFSLAIKAGRDRGEPAMPAIANMTADMLSKGTATKTTAEFEDAVKALGSSISISAGQFRTFVTGNTIDRNFAATLALVEEMLTEPRWDAEEFELLKRRRLNDIDQAAGDPNAIAAREAAKLLYPENHIFRYQPYGTKDKLEAVRLDDLKEFYTAHYAPDGADLRVVGNVDALAVERAFDGLSQKWTTPGKDSVPLPHARPVEASKVYFYDVPGAKQSVLRIQRPSVSAIDEDFPLATAMNFLLGDIYTSRLNTELRVNKGYTYGIRSGFSGDRDRGLFAVRSSVRSNVTLESMALIKDILGAFGPSFTQADLDVLKGALLRGQALQTETLGAKLGVLNQISAFDYPDDYLARNAERIEAMTLEDFKGLAERYLRPDAMDWLVVGDAQTQAARLGELGFGDPIMLTGE